MSGLHFHPLRVASLRRDTADAVVVGLDVPPELASAFRFEPGQYITLRHGELRRSYSICSTSAEGLRVGVRRVDGGAFSGWVHAQLQVGDSIDAMEPQGRFGAALSQRPRHVLAVAGGSGITPVIAIVSALLQTDPTARATLLYGNRSMASMMFKDALADLKNRHLARLQWHPVFSREVVDSPLANGRIDAARIAAVLRLAGAVDEAFVCGPSAMNDEVEAALIASGVAPQRIHIERFGVPPAAGAAPQQAQAGDATGARITVVRDGVTRDVAFGADDANILAAAVRAGLDLPYSCRSGVCATCRAKVLHGRVRMDRNFALEADDLEAGFVLTCQAHPLTDHVAVSFDER